MRCVAVACGLLAACTGPPRLVPPAPGAALASSSAEPVDDGAAGLAFAPSGEAMARYNDPLPPPAAATLLGDAVSAATREAARRGGLAVPAADPRLSAACADLAELVPGRLDPDATLETAAIEFALQRHGIIESRARLLFGWAEIDAPLRFVEQLRPKLVAALQDDAATRFGVGVAQRRGDGVAAIVFALQGSAISTLPISRAVATRASVEIDAVIDPRYRDPEVFVTRDDGRTRQLDVRAGRPGGFVARIECDDRVGRQQIEITGSDAAGSTVLANFPVWCGSEPPRSIRVDPVPDDPALGPEQAERYLLDSINRDRVAAGLPALVWDSAVAAVARSHSEDMRRSHLVVHISPTTGAAVDRVRAANITARTVLENVARDHGVREVHRALMNSPGHRANLMSSDVTRIGIGVVFGEASASRREVFVTQLFTSEFPTPVVTVLRSSR